MIATEGTYQALSKTDNPYYLFVNSRAQCGWTELSKISRAPLSLVHKIVLEIPKEVGRNIDQTCKGRAHRAGKKKIDRQTKPCLWQIYIICVKFGRRKKPSEAKQCPLLRISLEPEQLICNTNTHIQRKMCGLQMVLSYSEVQWANCANCYWKRLGQCIQSTHREIYHNFSLNSLCDEYQIVNNFRFVGYLLFAYNLSVLLLVLFVIIFSFALF